jgi:hypothetical protein
MALKRAIIKEFLRLVDGLDVKDMVEYEYEFKLPDGLELTLRLIKKEKVHALVLIKKEHSTPQE